MRESRHAAARRNQRGVSTTDAEFIMEYGVQLSAAGGAIRHLLTRKLADELEANLYAAIRQVRRARGKAIVEANGGSVITVMPQYRRLRRR